MVKFSNLSVPKEIRQHNHYEMLYKDPQRMLIVTILEQKTGDKSPVKYRILTPSRQHNDLVQC